MLAIICPIPAWIKRLVTIVHGISGKAAGCSPRNPKISLGFMSVAINSKKFIAINSHTGVKLKPRLYAITSLTPISGKWKANSHPRGIDIFLSHNSSGAIAVARQTSLLLQNYSYSTLYALFGKQTPYFCLILCAVARTHQGQTF